MERTKFDYSLEEIHVDPDELLHASLDHSDIDKLTIGLGLTDRCNLNCPKCYYREKSDFQRHDLDFAVLEKILNSLGNIGEIILGLEGEPLCHPRFSEILMLSFDHSASVAVVSNGLAISNSLLSEMRRAKKFRALIISCDGVDKESYEKHQQGGNFARFVRKASESAQNLGQRVSIHTVISNTNVSRLHEFPRFISSLGIFRLSISQLRTNRWNEARGLYRADESRIKHEIVKLAEEAECYGTEITFDDFFATPTLSEWLKTTVSSHSCLKYFPWKTCPYPWRFTSILSDCRLFPCCGDFNPIVLSDYSFDSIFNNDGLRKLRHCIRNHLEVSACKKCLGIT